MGSIFIRVLRARPVRRLLVVGLASGLAGAAFVAAANVHVLRAQRAHVHMALDAVPAADVALVPGCSPVSAGGVPNPHFENRLEAAAALYHAGRIRHILVSGANPTPGYDEPTAMRAGLVARGVPEAAVTCDFAGRRTLDSVVRARTVFGLDRVVIVTQRYHLDRALAIAAHHGLAAEGYAARDVPRRFSMKTEAREVLARAWVVLDLHVWQRRPHYEGPPEPIRLARE